MTEARWQIWVFWRQSQDHLSPCPVVVMLLQSAAGIYWPSPVIERRLRHQYLASAIPVPHPLMSQWVGIQASTAVTQTHLDASVGHASEAGRHACSEQLRGGPIDTCRLMIPKAACEMAKKSARSHQVGRQKHSAKNLLQASQL